MGCDSTSYGVTKAEINPIEEDFANLTIHRKDEAPRSGDGHIA